MCEVATLAGLALSAGSMVVGQMAANKVQSARNEVMNAERARQRQFDEQTMAHNVNARERYEGYGDKQDARSQTLGEYFKAQQAADATQAPATAGQTAPTSASNVTVAEESKQRGKARVYADKQGAALGELRSFGDLLGEIGRGQARDAGYIGQIGSFKKGSSALVPNELENANSAGNGFKTLGNILGLGGQLATGYGLQGSFVGPNTGASVAAPGLAGGLSPVSVLPPANPFRTTAGALPSFASPSSPFRLY